MSDRRLLFVEGVELPSWRLARLSTREWLAKFGLIKLLPHFAKECITVDRCIQMYDSGQLDAWSHSLERRLLDTAGLKPAICEVMKARAKEDAPKSWIEENRRYPAAKRYERLAVADSFKRSAADRHTAVKPEYDCEFRSEHSGAEKRSKTRSSSKRKGGVVYRSRDEMIAELAATRRSKKKKKSPKKRKKECEVSTFPLHSSFVEPHSHYPQERESEPKAYYNELNEDFRDPMERRPVMSLSTTTVYIRGLPTVWSEDEVRSYFENHGVVSSVKVWSDEVSGGSIGKAFVDFAHAREASACVSDLHGTYPLWQSELCMPSTPWRGLLLLKFADSQWIESVE